MLRFVGWIYRFILVIATLDCWLENELFFGVDMWEWEDIFIDF